MCVCQFVALRPLWEARTPILRGGVRAGQPPSAAGGPHRAEQLYTSCSHRVVQGLDSSLVKGFGQREPPVGGVVLSPSGWAGRPPSSRRPLPRDTYAEP